MCVQSSADVRLMLRGVVARILSCNSGRQVVAIYCRNTIVSAQSKLYCIWQPHLLHKIFPPYHVLGTNICCRLYIHTHTGGHCYCGQFRVLLIIVIVIIIIIIIFFFVVINMITVCSRVLNMHSVVAFVDMLRRPKPSRVSG